MRPALLVGVDTEGDDQWTLAKRERQTLENIYALPRLHRAFSSRGVRPTYLVTYSVAADPRAADLLRGMLDADGCEVGAHHHAWETPPCTEDDVRELRYAMQLPSDRFERQLTALTDAITKAVGRTPRAYRSGRFGMAAAHVGALARAGYDVDSSVVPLFTERHKGGPDFVAAPLGPYLLDPADLTRPGAGPVLEVPVTAGLSRNVPAALARAYARMPFAYQARRVLRKLGVAHMIWLRPSYSSVKDMARLARRTIDAGVPVLNVIFHSSEAIAGGSPYNRTDAEVGGWFDRLERFLDYAVRDLGAEPLTFSEFRQRHLAGGGADRASLAGG